MRMEIHRYLQALLEQSHQFRRTSRRYQATHILQGDHISAQRLQLKGLVQEILIRKNRLMQRPPMQSGFYSFYRGMVRIYRITDGTVGLSSKFLHITDRGSHVVHVVQSIENTHDIDTGTNRVPAKTFYNLVGIRIITE